ncbi:MAG: tRNA threonylcarbamoyladenosine dehydratase [Eubacteriales bacterium]|nr:tRNA threonylcarbamoyladenosine dehydratase [Eubacteriales bacterium]
MEEQFSRIEGLLGKDAIKTLANARVAVFGIGGVGGYTVEALARSGVGTLDLIDNDQVALSNLNRQIIATHETIGRYKVDVMKERILSINPDACVNVYPCFFLPENADTFPFEEYDYVVDAVDTVTAKIEIIMQAKKHNVPVISSMGAGNKLDPSAFRVADLYKTKVCPLAKVMRRELKKRNVKQVKVVYSEEEPLKPMWEHSQLEETGRRATPGSVAFVPSVAGLIMAGEIVKDMVRYGEKGNL